LTFVYISTRYFLLIDGSFLKASTVIEGIAGVLVKKSLFFIEGDFLNNMEAFL